LRDIARRFALTRRVAAASTAAVATLITVAALGAPSALAAGSVPAGSVKVTSSYEQSPISLTTSDSIGFAISNSTGSTLNNFSFTDALPPGVVLDDPIGLTNTAGSATTCGISTSVNPTTGATSAPGDDAVTITVATVPSAPSGTICSISLGIVANEASVNDAPYDDVLSSTFTTPKPTLTAAGLVVLSDPYLVVLQPPANRRYTLGEVVRTDFGCGPSDKLDSIASLFASDDEGNQVLPGAPLDTVDPGSHQLEFNCYSAAGGGDVTSDLDYTVGSYTVTAVKTNKKNGQVSYKALVPPGTFVAELLDGKKIIGKTTSVVKSRKTALVVVKLTGAGTTLVKKKDGKALKLKLDVSFTPKAVGAGVSEIPAAAPTVVTKSLNDSIAVAK
jgi:hypothetical protein